MEVRKIVVMLDRVVCLDSVRGNGESVREMRLLLQTSISSLPTMQQSIPRQWVQLLQISRSQLQQHHLLSLDSALCKLELAELKLNREQMLEALHFWDDLGYLRLHMSSVVACLVTDIPWLIGLLRALLHHNIVDSLQRVLDGKVAPHECDLAVAGPRCKLEGLSRKETESLLRKAADLEKFCIVHKELLPYLGCWSDLQTEEEVNAALEILEKCLFIAQYRIGDYAPVEWYVTSRIKGPEKSQHKPVNLDKLLRNGPVVCCRADYFMPPGLFSSLQAVQILRLRQSACKFWVPKADSTQLHVFLTCEKKNITALTGQHQQIKAGQDGSENHCLYLHADTLPLLTTLCCDWESIVREMFPGFMCAFSVLFYCHDFNAVYEWRVDPCSSDSQTLIQPNNIETPARWKKARGGLGYMLLHGLKAQSSAELALGFESEEASPACVQNIPLCEALHPLPAAARPFFFLSYCRDKHPSALSAAADRVLGGVMDLVEAVSGQDVFVSTVGKFSKAACRTAQKVIAVFSPTYLASRTSLLELGAALETCLGRGVPLLAVTVDTRVHACITLSGDNWLRDEWQVAEATLTLVREKIEDGSILIWQEWEDGSGMPTQARWEAAKRMIMLDTSDDPSACFPRRSKFVVVDEGGRPALREEERQ